MPAALISQMDPPPGEDAAFDAWYAQEHVPLRMPLPGFRGAVRGWAVHGAPSHLVVYHLDDLDALHTPAYREVKDRPSELTRRMLATVGTFTRYPGVEIGDTGPAPPGRYLYLVTFAVPAEHQAEFDAWYAQDHLPALLRNPAWLRCRRYAVHGSDPANVTRASLHELADVAALDSSERAEARRSPWRARLAERGALASPAYAVYERAQDFAGSATASPSAAGL